MMSIKKIIPEVEQIKYLVNYLFAIPTKNIIVEQHDDMTTFRSYTVHLLRYDLDMLSLDFKTLKKLHKKFPIFTIYHVANGLDIHIKSKDFFDYIGLG